MEGNYPETHASACLLLRGRAGIDRNFTPPIQFLRRLILPAAIEYTCQSFSSSMHPSRASASTTLVEQGF
jgi:hypothetical protein